MKLIYAGNGLFTQAAYRTLANGSSSYRELIRLASLIFNKHTNLQVPEKEQKQSEAILFSQGHKPAVEPSIIGQASPNIKPKT